MAAQPLISILLPFYQASTSLGPAIDSIRRQSLEAWELLLINNNADAATAQVAEAYGNRDSRIRILQEKRQGIAWALNTGLNHARAPFIARMDADDLAHPERLQKQYHFLRRHPEVGVVSCRCHFSSKLPKAAGYAHFVAWQNNLLSPEEHYRNRFRESPVAHPSVMFRSALVSRWGGYSTEALPEDYELWLRWMQAGVRFAKVNEPLLTWQDHPQRLSRTHAHYTERAFQKVRIQYLALWLQEQLPAQRKLVVCGASAGIRAKAQLLIQKGIAIWGYTDVKERKLPTGTRFLALDQLQEDPSYFFISLINKRGVGEQVRQLLYGLGFQEERDFILAG